MFKKIFVALMATVFSLLAQAVSFPVHHGYTEYNSFQNETVYNHDIHLTWNKDPDASKMGYYSQYAFYFDIGVIGYMGLQKDKDGKKAIFSIWDKPNVVSASPLMDWCRRFGHEGSGAQCIIPFEWKAGREYKIRVWKINEPGTEKWGAWVVDYATGEETLIGVIGTQGYGGLTGYSIAVIENYGPGDAGFLNCDYFKDFSVTWKGPYYNNGSKTAEQAYSRYTTGVGNSCEQQTNIETSSVGVVKMMHGVGVVNKRNTGGAIWDPQKTAYISRYDCLFNWAERQMPDVFDQRPFRHRRLATHVFNNYIKDYRDGGVGNALIIDKERETVIIARADGSYEDVGSVFTWLKTSQCLK